MTSLLDKTLPSELQAPTLETTRLLSLQALALFLKDDEGRAPAVLKQVLEMARVENWLLPFLRDGAPMEKLLRQALSKSICPEFIRKLLSNIEARPKPTLVPKAETLIEPLSERELEILTLLDGPLSTPEIAVQLLVSANTVRTHIQNIYGKLDLHGRSGAVRRAKEIRLLA
jgi:LuxR family maltose regulon positive regulatory protein